MDSVSSPDPFKNRSIMPPMKAKIKLDNKYNLVPFKHEKMDEFRQNFQGLKYHHEKTNLILQLIFLVSIL